MKVKNEFDFCEEYRGKQFVIEECDSSDDTYLCHPITGGYRIWFSEEKIEPVTPTLAEIKEKKLTCYINVRSIAEAQFLDGFFECKSYLRKYCENAYKERMRLGYCRTLEDGVAFQLTDGVINDNCSANFYRSCGGRYGEVYEFSDLVATGGTLPTSEWSKLIFKNGSSIEVLPQKDDTVKGKNHFCDGFRGGKIPTSGELIVSHTEMERAMDSLSAWATNVQLDKETIFNGLSQVLKRATEVYSSTKEEKNLKFTFYVTEGTRVDKSCNGTIPTMTTTVEANNYSRTAPVGTATCDKAVKRNELADKKKRTCTYCGKVLDTVEEKQAHEAWHVERRKARRERYLLRKRAKEIAFEEQAQKMAKEMIKEDK